MTDLHIENFKSADVKPDLSGCAIADNGSQNLFKAASQGRASADLPSLSLTNNDSRSGTGLQSIRIADSGRIEDERQLLLPGMSHRLPADELKKLGW